MLKTIPTQNLETQFNNAMTASQNLGWKNDATQRNELLNSFCELINKGHPQALKSLTEVLTKCLEDSLDLLWYLIKTDKIIALKVMQQLVVDYAEITNPWSLDKLALFIYYIDAVNHETEQAYQINLHDIFIKLFSIRYKDLNIELPENLIANTKVTEIGHGTYATVYSSTIHNKLVALKHFRRFKLFDTLTSDTVKIISEHYSSFLRELIILSLVKNKPNLINVLYYQNDSFPIIITELGNEGSLTKFTGKNTLSTIQQLSFAKQIWQGVATLFSMNILHRDLAPKNIIVNNINGLYSLQIIDMGSAIMHVDLALEKQKCLTTYNEAAPELFCDNKKIEKQYRTRLGKTDNEPIPFYSQMSEIYAYAMTILTMITNKYPYMHELPKIEYTDLNVMAEYVAGHGRKPCLPTIQWDAYPQGFQNILDRMQDHDPNKRPNSDEITQYFAKNSL